MARRGTAVAIALLLGGAALAIAGCGLGAGNGVGTVDLSVTREFGTVKVSESSGEANESDTVMRFLEGEDEIETRYGGGYVKSIDGIGEGERGGHPYDWFFYVDGVESPVGAAEISLDGGERVWWDIHDWSATEHVPAVVGSWPAPFTTGWEGHAPPLVTVECHGGGAACGTVQSALRHAGARVGFATEGPESGPGHEPITMVLVGPWAKVRSNSVATLIEGGPAESGVYADFEAKGGGWDLIGLDENGEEARDLGPDAGLVAATRRFEGPPVWIVTGGTAAAVRAAAGALDGKDLRNRFAVASVAGKVTPLPLGAGSG